MVIKWRLGRWRARRQRRTANVLFSIRFPAFQRAANALSSFSCEISAYLVLWQTVKSLNSGNNFSAGMVNAKWDFICIKCKRCKRRSILHTYRFSIYIYIKYRYIYIHIFINLFVFKKFALHFSVPVIWPQFR